MNLLDALFRDGHLRTLDHAFARSLQRLQPDTPDAVLAAAALASLAVSKGHAGLALHAPDALVEDGPQVENAPALEWPAADAWQTQLADSPWVSTPDDPAAIANPHAPLVLEPAANGRPLLYLRRYREYERRLAAGLRRIGSHTPSAGDVIMGVPTDSSDRHPRAEPAPSEGGGGGPRTFREEHSTSMNPHLRGSDAVGVDRSGALPQLFAQLFPNAHTGNDRQARAAALALRHHLLLVTGGPGTGKTTTIARLLVLLAAQAARNDAPPPRIALAAPTGRAAERMAESVRNALATMRDAGIDNALIDALPTTGTTLHRLLGTIPDAPDFRHNADNPLAYDVVVVDEASMVDLPLMAKLVEAVPDGARLVLLGDPDQLPSVEAGDVLAAILQAAGPGDAVTQEDAEALTPLLGSDLVFDRRPRDTSEASEWRSQPEGRARQRELSGDPRTFRDEPSTSMGSRLRGSDESEIVGTSFPGRRVHLIHGHRQHQALQLAPLADAVRAGDAATALALLRDNALGNVRFHEHAHEGFADPLTLHRDTLLAYWRSLARAESPAQALALANRLRLLAAVREGPQGANHLNARIEAMLFDGGRSASPHFHGRLLLITQNSYAHRLFNGDIGICFRNADGAVMAWFPGDTPDAPRAFHPAALPAHQSAFAMTVHKAQGSEFDTVWLLLPARPNRVLSRELVYTGITRARSALHLVGSADVLQAALARHASRVSGLGWRLV